MKRLEKRRQKKCERREVGDMSIKEQIAEYNPDAVIFDDLDDAIIGVGQQHGMSTVAIYDRDKCIEILAKSYIEEGVGEGDAYTDAVDYFGYNVECLYAGKNTPIIMERFEDNS